MNEKRKITVADLMGPNGGIMFGTTEVMPGQYRVKKIKLHWKPHFEELVALAAIREGFCEDMVPGAMEAEINLVDAGWKQVDALEDLKQGVLQIGIGNGPINEHETDTRLSIDGECGATLLAKLCRFADDRAFGMLLKFALRSDVERVSPLDFPELLKAAYTYEPDEVYVVTAGVRFIRAHIKNRQDFLTGARMELEQKFKNGGAKAAQVLVAGGSRHLMIWLRSDERAVAAYARSKEGKNAAIVVQEQEPGRFYIPVNKRAGIRSLGEVVRILRISELQKQGKSIPEGVYERLDDEVCPECPEWHFDRDKTHSIFGGGSQSNVETPKSKLTLDEVVVAVRRGLIRGSHGGQTAGLSRQTNRSSDGERRNDGTRNHDRRDPRHRRANHHGRRRDDRPRHPSSFESAPAADVQKMHDAAKKGFTNGGTVVESKRPDEGHATGTTAFQELGSIFDAAVQGNGEPKPVDPEQAVLEAMVARAGGAWAGTETPHPAEAKAEA